METVAYVGIRLYLTLVIRNIRKGQGMKYLYKIKYQGHKDKPGDHTYRFIAAHTVHEALIIVGYEHGVGLTYGVPILEVMIDKELKDET